MPPDRPTLSAAAAATHILGVVFREPSHWADVRLTADEMPTEAHRALYRTFRRFHEQGTEPDRATLTDAFIAMDVDVSADLLHALATQGKPANLDAYQAIVERAARLERAKGVHAVLADRIEAGDADGAWQALLQASDDAPARTRVETKDVLWRVFEWMTNPPPALATGLGPLDGLLDGGLRAGDVFVLAARPGVGKSALALQFVLHVALGETPVALWSLEMSAEQWMRRALASLAAVDARRLKTGRLTETDLEAAEVASRHLHRVQGCIRFANDADTTPAGLRMEAAEQVRSHGCGLLVIDYLQLMQPAPEAWSRENEVATLSRTLKLTAKALGVPVVVLAQLNRDAEDRVPTLANLRESGAIEQDADMVFFLHRGRDKETNTLEKDGLGVLAKHRDGETGTFAVRYQGAHYKFLPLTAENY